MYFILDLCSLRAFEVLVINFVTFKKDLDMKYNSVILLIISASFKLTYYIEVFMYSIVSVNLLMIFVVIILSPFKRVLL